MTNYISEKIRVLSAFAILVVLYIHSGFHANELLGMEQNLYIQEFFSGMIGRCAVPLFYIISGYLFFLSGSNLSSIYDKMLKRIKTLLIPYIVSSIFFVAVYVLIDFIPGTEKFMNNDSSGLFKKDLLSILRNVFYKVDGGASPIAGQLWFLRDLMILVVFAPVWFYLYKYFKWAWIPLVFVLNYLHIPIFPIYALFWFSLGGALKYLKTPFLNQDTYKFLGLLCILCFLICCFVQLFSQHFYLWGYLKIPIILLGIVAIWHSYDLVVSSTFSLKKHRILEEFCSFTFFIYLFHQPTINIARKLVVFAIGKSSIGYLTSYFLSPLILIAVAIPVGILLKKSIPKVYEIATGGR